MENFWKNIYLPKPRFSFVSTNSIELDKSHIKKRVLYLSLDDFLITKNTMQREYSSRDSLPSPSTMSNNKPRQTSKHWLPLCDGDMCVSSLQTQIYKWVISQWASTDLEPLLRSAKRF
jgi:hypothetical protein